MDADYRNLLIGEVRAPGEIADGFDIKRNAPHGGQSTTD
jgi:hypothetical protein